MTELFLFDSRVITRVMVNLPAKPKKSINEHPSPCFWSGLLSLKVGFI